MCKRSMEIFRHGKLYKLFNAALFLLLTGFCLETKAQNIQVEAKLDRDSLRIGEQVLLHISARMPVKTQVVFPQLVDSIGKVQIVKSLKADTTFDKNNPNQQTVTHSYALTSFDPGVYVLPGFTFQTPNGELKTGTVTLQVKAVQVDTTKAFYDIKQPLTVSYTFWDWLKDHWLMVLIVLVAVLLTAGSVYYYQKRPKKDRLFVKPDPILPVDVIALNKLNELRDKKLWQQGEVKLYYSELSDVLREYLEKRYQISTQEQTTDEILLSLKQKEIPQESRTLLNKILTLADLVKFAKEKPTAFENGQTMENAIDFVVQTKHRPQSTEQKEEDLPK